MVFILNLAISCGTPPSGANLEPAEIGTDLKYGQQYVYSCVAGYKLATGSSVINCTEDGSFHPETIPICTGRCNKYINIMALRYSLLIYVDLTMFRAQLKLMSKPKAAKNSNINEFFCLTIF